LVGKDLRFPRAIPSHLLLVIPTKEGSVGGVDGKRKQKRKLKPFALPDMKPVR
jgi:hypothetical protein